MKTFNNIRRAFKLLRRNDGIEFNMSLDEVLKWAPHLEEIDVVLGRMSKSDFEMFVSCDGDPKDSRKLIRTLPVEWAATKKTQAQWRKSLRFADKFLDAAY